MTVLRGSNNFANYAYYESSSNTVMIPKMSLYTCRPVCDVAISGLGWICVEPVNSELLRRSNLGGKPSAAGVLVMAVSVPKPVEIFIRSPMPVGKDGGEWYEFRELTEKEEEERPKWYF